ncbi:orotate phosphoribosyltransferase [Bacillaceae bacterium]
MREEIAKELLKIKAVYLRPDEPFTWTSGIKSPIYCDNRLTLSYPQVRRKIAEGFVRKIAEHFPEAELIAGTATAGIPHAAWVAERLDLPMVYVRPKAKSHGRQNRIEGKLEPGQKTVVIEDLISTGGSSLEAVRALVQEGAQVLGVLAIFSYRFPQAERHFAEAGVSHFTLTDYPALIRVALQEGYVTQEQLELLDRWRQDPETFSLLQH